MNPIDWPLGDDASVRTLTPEDAEAVFAAVDANRDRLHLWMPWEEGTRSPADSRAFIEHALASKTDLDANGIWVGDAYAGGIGMRVDVMNEHAEIGYWLALPFEGRGLVTRACRRFIDHAFGPLELHRVAIMAGVANVRSRAVPERLGFTQEAILREAGRVGGGAYVDLVVYGLLSTEWPPA